MTITRYILKKLCGLSPRANYTNRGPPLIGEVSANFSRQRVSRGQRNGSPGPYSQLSRPQNHYYFFHAASELYSQGWVDPVPDSLLHRKSGNAGNRTPDLWLYSQELWRQENRGGQHQVWLSKLCEMVKRLNFQTETSLEVSCSKERIQS
jgi:hypothetical protein